MIGQLLAQRRPLLMGILNLTPDSFSSGSRQQTLSDHLALAEQLIADGADLLDIGGESTRPGANAVPLAEERTRLLPFLEIFRKRHPDFPISLDTTKAALAHEIGRDYKLAMLNDVSCLSDPAMTEIAAKLDCYYVLMHSRGTPGDMMMYCDYPDGVVTGVKNELQAALERCIHILPRSKIILDLGFGFAKTPAQCQELLENLAAFKSFALPIMLGISRKRFLTLYGAPVEASERDAVSARLAVQATHAGAVILRVHNVKLTKNFLTSGVGQG